MPRHALIVNNLRTVGNNRKLTRVSSPLIDISCCAGEFFGTERLEACGCEGFAAIERAVTEFRGSMPLNDDCTITEVVYCD